MFNKNYSIKFKDGRKARVEIDYCIFQNCKEIRLLKENLIADFSNCNNMIIYNYDENNIIKCGDTCLINCFYSHNEFYLGKNCLVKDIARNNIIYSCKSNCQVELFTTGNLINKFFIPTNYSIKTNWSKTGFEIVK